MLGTLLEASPLGARWPSFRDARTLITGGLRVRGWTWLMSMLWVAAGTSRLAAAQLALRSCVGRRVGCRLRALEPGRCLGNVPRERRLPL
jgi:hypothetical protein